MTDMPPLNPVEYDKKKNNPELMCPKCKTGRLEDMGAMFMVYIRCNNPNCDYVDFDATGCVTA